MGDSEINDIRTKKEFKGITFSNYKRSDCKKQLLNALVNGIIEPACYWSIEYICSGHFLELWEIILLFASKYIHLGNPRLPLYLNLRFGNFKDIIQTGYEGNEIKMRNNPKIRILFAEVISILCLSSKKHSLSQIKVQKNSFNMSNMSDNLKADNVYYAKPYFKRKDPKELFIALNEFVYHLQKTKSAREACFWLEWILEFETICKRDKNHTLMAEARYLTPIQNKFTTDVIWIIWEIISSLAASYGENVVTIINSWMKLFSIRYKSGSKKRRRFILYDAISILTDKVDVTTPIYKDESKIENVKNKINLLYKQLKKREKKPATDYLFNNSITNGENNNLEKTIAKLDKLNSMNTIIYNQ